MEPAGIGLEKIVARSLRQAPPGKAPLMAWPVVCGSAVAFQDGVLSVEVADQGWKLELQALAQQYILAINRYTTEAVRKIEFVVSRPPSENQ